MIGFFCRYNPSSFISNSPELREALDQIRSGFYCQEDPDRFRELHDDLTTHDYFMLCADFTKYIMAQAAVEEAYKARDVPYQHFNFILAPGLI